MEKSVKQKFEYYPKEVAVQLRTIRSLILQTAKKNGINKIEETLKCGEHSYLVKGGSTIRIDRKPKSQKQYCLYFNCKTKLVETFKELYANTFKYEANLAIVFQ